MLRIMPEGGGGDKPVISKQEGYNSKGRTEVDDMLDVRDILSALVGKGITNLDDDSNRAHYQSLIKLVGAPKASKLMAQVFNHNTRAGASQLPVEKRIQDFYEIGSGDEETAQTLKKVKALSQGVLPGYRESILHDNQLLAGRASPSTASVDNSNLQQKVMLRLQK